MRLTRIRPVGRYQNPKTNTPVNVHTGRQLGRSIDVLFYYYRGTKKFINDREFYNTWEKVKP